MPVPGSRAPWRSWSAEEDAKLVELCSIDSPQKRKRDTFWIDAAAQLPGRTGVACQQRWLVLRGKKEKRHDIKKPRPQVRSFQHSSTRPGMQQPVHLPEHDSITHMICGDPRPGRSALDQRRLQTA